MRYFAIGDVHGMFDMLDALIEYVSKDMRPEDRFVFLGDYVDRGPNSNMVVSLVRDLTRDGHVALKGNHEDMVDGAHPTDTGFHATAYEMWMINGGTETLRSYGGKVPDDVVEWARALPTHYHPCDDFYFVHAGLMPGVPLDEQSVDAKLWVRRPFTSTDHDFGPRVVYGHTPQKVLDHRPHRTNLDTAAVFNGWLSCGVFEPGRRDALYVYQANGKRDVHADDYPMSVS